MAGPSALHGLIAVVALGAAAALAWAAPQVGLLEAALAMVAVAAAEWTAASHRAEVKVSMANIVVLVVLLTGGPALATVSALGVVPAVARRATTVRWERIVFNGAQLVLAAFVAGLIYRTATSALNVDFPQAGALIAVAAAAVAYSVTNQALVAIPVAMTTSEAVGGVLRTMLRSLPLQIPNVGLTVLAATLLLYVGPWALLLMVVPAAVTRRALAARERVDEAYDRLVRGFVKAIEVKDLYTRGHSDRVAILSTHVAERLSVPYEQRRLTRYAALLHDIGKIGVPRRVIDKPGTLDDAEHEAMKEHPRLGAEILRDIDFLAPGLDVIAHHHERLDGRGYPYGVAGDRLGLPVRIVTAVDAFDAMTSTRSHRDALSVAGAVEELRAHTGSQFDPEVVEAVAATVDELQWRPTTAATGAPLPPLPDEPQRERASTTGRDALQSGGPDDARRSARGAAPGSADHDGDRAPGVSERRP